MRVEIAMMRTPDGHGRLELSRFLAPPVVADHRGAPVNALVGEVVRYENMYRLCYIRGPEGVLIGLAEQLGQQASRENPLGR
jgi:hypothetical protein